MQRFLAPMQRLLAAAAIVATAACMPTSPTPSSVADEVTPGSKGKVLVVVSAADAIQLKSGRMYKSGYFLRELSEPLARVLKAGYAVEFATPGGTAPTIDTNGLELVWYFYPDPTAEPMARVVRAEALRLVGEHLGQLRFSEPKATDAPDTKMHVDSADVQALVQATKAAQASLAPIPPLALESLVDGARADDDQPALSGYAAVLVPGGHAPMADLAKSASMGKLLRYFHAKHKPTALICHAPIALMATKADATWDGNATTDDPSWIYHGYRMTVASKAEEQLLETFGPVAPDQIAFYVDLALQGAGAVLNQSALPGGPMVSADRELITGQNPASAPELGDVLVDSLARAAAAADADGWWTDRPAPVTNDLTALALIAGPLAAAWEQATDLPPSLEALQAQVASDATAGADGRVHLDQMFRAATARADYLEMPDGDATGVSLFTGDDADAVTQTNDLASAVWRGKVFQRQDGHHATLVNKVLGIPFIQATVDNEQALASILSAQGWSTDGAVDDAPSIVLDYGAAEIPVARTIRDEIRKIAPGLYLGRATLSGEFVVYFALQFPAA